MICFEQSGKENTGTTLQLALDKAMELNTDIVLSSTRGDSARELVELAEQKNFNGKLIVVRSVSSAKNQGVNAMNEETVQYLKDHNVILITAAHALSAAERGMSSQFGGVYPIEIMAHTLRTFGQGTKVCFECSVMALDADVISYDKAVVAVGGTGHGVDTAMVITPSYSATILQTKIHEILCKPY